MDYMVSDIHTRGPSEKQFQLINTFLQSYDYSITSITREKNAISFLRIEFFIFVKTWVPFTQECFAPSLIEIAPVVPEKKILKFRQCIFSILLLSPLVK